LRGKKTMRHDAKVVVFSKKTGKVVRVFVLQKNPGGYIFEKIGYIFENSFKIYIYLKFRSSPAL
jgi:hypothetical protein